MAKDYYDLLSQIDAKRIELARLLASDRPDDAAAAQQVYEALAQLEEDLLAIQQSQESSPDEAFANLLALDGRAPTLDGTLIVPDVKRFDETVAAERIFAVADLYFIYMHERLGVFNVTLELQRQFKSGEIKVSTGEGAQRLYRYKGRRALRYTRAERHQAYRRVFGYYSKVQPPVGSHPFDEFHRMFTGFNKGVAQFSRDRRVSEVVKGNQATQSGFGSIATVRRSGLDLRTRLKKASYGHINVLTREVAQLLRSAFEILEAPDIKNLYGADDAWDVIEVVSRQRLRKTTWASQRNRMAVTGRDILRWLAGPAVLNPSRPQFEIRLREIEDACEEWITSERAIVIGTKTGSRAPSSNVVSMRKATG